MSKRRGNSFRTNAQLLKGKRADAITITEKLRTEIVDTWQTLLERGERATQTEVARVVSAKVGYAVNQTAVHRTIRLAKAEYFERRAELVEGYHTKQLARLEMELEQTYEEEATIRANANLTEEYQALDKDGNIKDLKRKTKDRIGQELAIVKVQEFRLRLISEINKLLGLYQDAPPPPPTLIQVAIINPSDVKASHNTDVTAP